MPQEQLSGNSNMKNSTHHHQRPKHIPHRHVLRDDSPWKNIVFKQLEFGNVLEELIFSVESNQSDHDGHGLSECQGGQGVGGMDFYFILYEMQKIGFDHVISVFQGNDVWRWNIFAISSGDLLIARLC
jgi:hypothetical protein